MVKVVSFAARRDITAQHAAVELVGLMTIRPVDGGDVIRICTSAAVRFSDDPLRYGVISNGQRFDFMAVRFVLPDSSKDALPATSLEVDNIDPLIVEATRTSVYRATIDFDVVLSTRPDEIMESYPGMEITEASWNEDVVTLVVGYESLATTPLVRHRLTVSTAPALRAAT